MWAFLTRHKNRSALFLEWRRTFSLISLISLSVFIGSGCGRTELKCTTHSECIVGQACIEGQCLDGDACVEGLCPSSFTCIASICVPDDFLPQECDEQNPCMDPLICLEGRCVNSCDNGNCLPCDPLVESCVVGCSQDQECGVGQICEGTQ